MPKRSNIVNKCQRESVTAANPPNTAPSTVVDSYGVRITVAMGRSEHTDLQRTQFRSILGGGK